MKHINIYIRLPIIVIISISFGILLPSSTAYSQSSLRIDEEPGGGGNGGSQQTDNSDNTLIYVVAGALLVGAITYYIISKNKKREREQEVDTTSAFIGYSNSILAVGFTDFDHELQKVKDSIPVDLIIGIRNERGFISDKIYLMGVAIRF